MADFELEKCCLTQYPSSVLNGKCKPIVEVDDDIRKLVDRMIDIMVETKGVGLAGPQAGVDLRIFVISLDGTREQARAFINPTIEPSGPLVADAEGCLSLPGIGGQIKRHAYCKVTATDLDGNEFKDEGDGLFARALQHEYDHLEGIMIKDRLGPAAKMRAKRLLNRLKAQADKNKAWPGKSNT